MNNKLEIEVLLAALVLLENESKWKKNAVHGEVCNEGDEKMTLGCAMEIAQLKVRGEKIKRSKEMRVLRRTIYMNYLFRAGIHPITYFSRHKKTNYSDIVKVLQLSIQKLKN